MSVTKVHDSQTAGNRVSNITYCDGYQPWQIFQVYRALIRP